MLAVHDQLLGTQRGVRRPAPRLAAVSGRLHTLAHRARAASFG
jgi:hypothetical protein